MLPPWRVAARVEEKHVSSQSLLSWIRCERTNWLTPPGANEPQVEAALSVSVSVVCLQQLCSLRRLRCAFKYYLFYRVCELPTWKSMWAPYRVGWWRREHRKSRCNTSRPSSHCFKTVRKKKNTARRFLTVGNFIHNASGEVREKSKT